MFEHLKRLKLNSALSNDFDFDKLNQFSTLEGLNAHVYFNAPVEKTLKLPRLQVLDLKFKAVPQSNLTVDCPVKVLAIHNCSFRNENSNVPAPLNLVYPDLLEEVIFTRKARLLNLSACKNVRYCRDYQYLDHDLDHGLELNLSEVFPVDHLETFPNLQELHYQCNFSGNVSEESSLGDLMNAVRRKISGALQKKRQQNRTVKIFFQGIQLEGEHFFESLKLNTMSDLPSLQFKHYDLLPTNLYYYNKIDYSSLEKHFDDLLPVDLFNRFTCVNTVIATGGVKHLDQFATFLRQCKYLCQLKVEIDSVDQAFCDQLHVNCFFLKKLVFRDRTKEESNEGDQGDLANVVDRQLVINDDPPFKKLNFDFLAKQINLVDFAIDEFDIETALKCLEICPKLCALRFAYFKGNICIRSWKKNSYSLKGSLYKSFKQIIKVRCNQLSFEQLASDLAFLKKRFDKMNGLNV